MEEEEEEKPIYDNEGCFEERVKPDEGELLVIRRVLHTIKITPNDEQREHVFHSRCTIKGKVCSLIIDLQLLSTNSTSLRQFTRIHTTFNG